MLDDRAFQRLDTGTVGGEMHRKRLRPPAKLDAFLAGLLVFEGKSGHVLSVTAVDDPYGFGAQAAGCPSGVDGGVARSDDHDAAAHGEHTAGFVALDEFEGVDDGGMIFAGNAEPVHGPETDAQENGLVMVF